MSHDGGSPGKEGPGGDSRPARSACFRARAPTPNLPSISTSLPSLLVFFPLRSPSSSSVRCRWLQRREPPVTGVLSRPPRGGGCDRRSATAPRGSASSSSPPSSSSSCYRSMWRRRRDFSQRRGLQCPRPRRGGPRPRRGDGREQWERCERTVGADISLSCLLAQETGLLSLGSQQRGAPAAREELPAGASRRPREGGRLPPPLWQCPLSPSPPSRPLWPPPPPAAPASGRSRGGPVPSQPRRSQTVRTPPAAGGSSDELRHEPVPGTGPRQCE